MPACQIKAANTDRILSATDGLIASTTGPMYSGVTGGCRDALGVTGGLLTIAGLSGGRGLAGVAGLTGTTFGAGIAAFTAGSSFKLSRETSIDVVEMAKIARETFVSDSLRLE